MPRIEGGGGTPAPKPVRPTILRRPPDLNYHAPPPPTLLPPLQWVSQRASQIHPDLARVFPDLGFSFLKSGIPTQRLADVTGGVWDLIATGKVPNITLPGLQGSLTTQPGYGAPGRGQIPSFGAPVAHIPTQTQARVVTLDPKYRTVGNWLAEQTSISPSFGLRRTEKLSVAQDPNNLSDLVLYTKQVGGRTLVVLRSTVQDFLATGTKGKSTSRLLTPGEGGVPLGRGASVTTTTTGAPAPNDPNYQRALQIIGIVKTVYPDAQIEYQSGGIFGQIMAQTTSVENLVAPIVSEGAQVGPGGPILSEVRSLRGMPDPSLPDLFQQSLTTSNLDFGPQAAQVAGIKPTDPGYAAFTGVVNFAADWYLNPFVVAGKIGAGLRLASRVPSEIGGLKGLAGLVYESKAKNIVDLVTDTPQGQSLVSSIVRTADRSPQGIADDLVRTHGFTPNQATIMAEAAKEGPVATTEALINHFRGLSEPDVAKYLGRDKALDESITNLRRQRDHPPADVAGDVTQVQDAIGERLAAAVAEKQVISEKLRYNPALDSFDPLRQLPKMKPSSRLMEAASDLFGGSPLGQWFERHIIAPADIQLVPGTRVNLNRLFTPVVKGEPLWLPWAPGAPRDAMQKMRDGWAAVLTDHGVPVEHQAPALSRLMAAKTQEEVWLVLEHDVGSAIVEHGKSPIDFRLNDVQLIRNARLGGVGPGVIDKAGQTWAGGQHANYETMFTKTRVSAEGDKLASPQPFLRVHLADRIYLPDHEHLLDLTGAWRKMLQKVFIPIPRRAEQALTAERDAIKAKITEATTASAKNDLYEDLAAVERKITSVRWGRRANVLPVWRAEQHLLDRVTRAWRNGILLGRPIAVFLRTFGEESVRAAASGFASLVSSPWEWLHYTYSLRERMWDLEMISNAGRRVQAAEVLARTQDLPAWAIMRRLQLRKEFNAAIGGDMASSLGFIHNVDLDTRVRQRTQGLALSLQDPNAEVQTQAWEALRNQHHQAMSDDLARQALRSENADQLMTWARTQDGRNYIRDMAPVYNGYDMPPQIERAGQVSLEDFRNKFQTMDEAHANATFDQVYRGEFDKGTPGLGYLPPTLKPGPAHQQFVWRNDQGDVVGVFEFTSDQGRIQGVNLSVAREAQGQGVARQLIDAAHARGFDVYSAILEGRVPMTKDSATLFYKLMRDKGLLPSRGATGIVNPETGGQTWYHGTQAQFGQLELGHHDFSDPLSALGLHFGSSEAQATARGSAIQSMAIDIKSPYRVQSETDLYNEMLQFGIERKLLSVPSDLQDTESSVQIWERQSPETVRRVADAYKADLRSKGYDGILYGNQVEGNVLGETVTQRGRAGKGPYAPSAIIFDPAQAHVPTGEIEGVTEPRLRAIFERTHKWTEHISGGDGQVKQAILNGGVYEEGVAQTVRDSLAQLTEARKLYREHEVLLEAGHTSEAEQLLLESRRLNMNAKDVMKAAHISDRDLARMEADLTGTGRFKEKYYHPITSPSYAEILKTKANAGEWKAPVWVAGSLHDAPSSANFWQRRVISNWLYQKTLSGPEAYLSRSPIYRQMATKRYNELISLGWEKAAARRKAAFDGAEQARQLLYDLTERTSAQTFARHLAPFLPAWQEILTTWAWKLPQRYYPIVGHAFLATRAGQVIEAMKALGVDPSKPQTFGPLGWLLDAALNTPGVGPQYKATYNPKDLNLVAQNIMPGLGPIPAVAVGQLVKKFPVLTEIGKVLLPYGVDVQIGPATINRAWEAVTKQVPPWEAASLEHQETTYAFAKFDAMRHARVLLSNEGIFPPKESDYPNNIPAYQKAQSAYVTKLTGEADHIVLWSYLYRSIAGTFFPAPLHVTDSYKEDIAKFYNQISGMASSSPEAEQAWAKWLQDHPYGDFYRTGGTVQTKQIPQGKYARYHDAYSKLVAEMQQGDRRLRTPEEFVQMGLGFASRSVLNNQLQHALADIGPENVQLTNWYKRSQLIDDAFAKWDQYLVYNPEFAGMWNNLIQKAHPNAFVSYSFSLDQLAKFYRIGRELQGFDTINGISQTQLRNVLVQAGQALAAANKFSGGRYKGIDWWFTSVATPAWNHLDTLYKQADKWKQLESPSRPDAYVKFSLAMEKIREYKASQTKQVGPDGRSYPTIEEFSWGNLPATSTNPADPSQQQKVVDWLTLKPEWLTPFALSKIGVKGNPAQLDKMSAAVATYDGRLATYISAHNISTSSNEYQSLQSRRQTDLAGIAASLGPAASKLWNLSNMTTAERMLATGWAKSKDNFGQATLFSEALRQQITAKGYSYKSSSQYATAIKGAFYQIIDRWYRSDPAFQADINQIQVVLGKDPDHPATRYATYAAVFFDDRGGL